MSKEIKALLESVEGISEEVALKASTVFEAAVIEAVEKKTKKEIKGIEEAFNSKLEKAKEKLAEEYATKLDKHITDAVVDWANKNAVTLDKSLKCEVAESFLTNLKSMFAESAVLLPDMKIDAITESVQAEKVALGEKVAVIEAVLAEKIAVIESFQKEKIIRELSEGLADTQKERLATIAKQFGFTNESEFAIKVNMIKEMFDEKKDDKKVDTKKKEKETEIKETEVQVVESVTDENKINLNESSIEAVFARLGIK